MKTLIVNTYDTRGGAARAAYRLHTSLGKHGVDSSMLVDHKYGTDPKVMGATSTGAKVRSFVRKGLDFLPTELYKREERTIFYSGFVPDNIADKVKEVDPGIVHLHWVCGGFMRVETLLEIEQPIVWTLHDMWAFTGGCHYSEGCTRYEESCGECPQLESTNSRDLSNWVWRRKERAWDSLNITVVTPSRWLADCARASSLFKGRRIEVIPNGIDTGLYRPVSRHEARRELGLPVGKRLILFGAVGALDDKRKGFHLLEPALKRLERMISDKEVRGEIELVIFGAEEPESPPDLGFKTSYLGSIHDDETISKLYGAADLFVTPSMQDNLPNTIMESMASGTPVVAFGIGGIPEMIVHKETGYIAEPFDIDDLARGLAWVLGLDGEGGGGRGRRERVEALGKAGREKAVREYSEEVLAERHISLYEELKRPEGVIKTLIFNTYDTKGGAARATYRLHRGLKSLGLDSKMEVQHKYTADPKVHGPTSTLSRGLDFGRKVLDYSPVELYRRRERKIFYPAYLPGGGVRKRIDRSDAQIIHLNWVSGGYLRIEDLKGVDRPIVWTLHDVWPFTGGCHVAYGCRRYEGSCGECPELESTKDDDLSRRVWKRKMEAWKDLDITIVTPSRWLAGCAGASSLFKDRTIKVVPNGLDTDLFKPLDRDLARERMGLPKDKKLILFSALNAEREIYKGYRFLEPILRALADGGYKDEVETVMMGKSEPRRPVDLAVKARYLGPLNRDSDIVSLYNAVDLTIVPSTEESFGQLASESLACATPVVAFGIAGLLDIVDRGENGYLAEPFDTDDFAKGIMWVLEDTERGDVLGTAGREKVLREYTVEVQARRIEAIYRSILERRSGP